MNTLHNPTIVRCEPFIVDDELDPIHHGTQQGVDYVAGEGHALVEAHVGNVIYDQYPWIEIFLGEHDGDHLEDIEAMLPSLIAIVNDPRVQAEKAAMAAYRATLPPEEIEAAQRRKVHLLHHWHEGFEKGRKDGITETLSALRALFSHADAEGKAVTALINEITASRDEPAEQVTLRGVTPSGVSVYRGTFTADDRDSSRSTFLRLAYNGLELDLYDDPPRAGLVPEASITLNRCKLYAELTAVDVAAMVRLFADPGIRQWLAEQESERTQ